MSKFLKILAHLIFWPTLGMAIIAFGNLGGIPFINEGLFMTGLAVIFVIDVPLFLISFALYRLAVTKEKGVKFWQNLGKDIKSFWVHDEEE